MGNDYTSEIYKNIKYIEEHLKPGAIIQIYNREELDLRFQRSTITNEWLYFKGNLPVDMAGRQYKVEAISVDEKTAQVLEQGTLSDVHFAFIKQFTATNDDKYSLERLYRKIKYLKDNLKVGYSVQIYSEETLDRIFDKSPKGDKWSFEDHHLYKGIAGQKCKVIELRDNKVVVNIPGHNEVHNVHYAFIESNTLTDDDESWDDIPDRPEDRPEGEEVTDWEVEDNTESEVEKLPPVKFRDIAIKEELKIMKPHPVLLEGPVGSGKSTILKELAEELGLNYYANVLTDQTSASEFKGYKNVMNGEYVRTEFREAVEHGGMFVLEELNAATSNMPIIFNTIQNGFFVFADKVVKLHPDFWLVATMNTITNAKDFGGRRLLDKSVRDRFHTIYVEPDLQSRFKQHIIVYMKELNKILDRLGITDKVTPRDLQRFEHMVSKGVDEVTAIHKCLIKGRANLDPADIEELVKTGGEWR